MWTAFSLALRDALEPAGRRALLISLAGSLVLLVALWFGATAMLAVVHVSRFHWLDTVVDVVGGIAGLLIAWLLFPAIAMMVLGFFIDPFVVAVERTHYPRLARARKVGVGEFFGSALRLTLLAVILNLVILPAYFLPVIGAALYFGLNGYLVGRQCFESVAFRRMAPDGARTLWRRNRGRLSVAGMIIVVLLSLPLINLIAPLIGAAFMLHLLESLRRPTPVDAATHPL